VLFFGLEGHSDSTGRDLTIDAMKASADRISRIYGSDVTAVRYDDGPWITDGFLVRADKAKGRGEVEQVTETRVVPVRRRRRWLGRRWVGRWQTLQSVPSAAHDVGAWLRYLRQPSTG
jgi:hypothetical protein